MTDQNLQNHSGKDFNPVKGKKKPKRKRLFKVADNVKRSVAGNEVGGRMSLMVSSDIQN